MSRIVRPDQYFEGFLRIAESPGLLRDAARVTRPSIGEWMDFSALRPPAVSPAARSRFTSRIRAPLGCLVLEPNDPGAARTLALVCFEREAGPPRCAASFLRNVEASRARNGVVLPFSWFGLWASCSVSADLLFVEPLWRRSSWAVRKPVGDSNDHQVAFFTRVPLGRAWRRSSAPCALALCGARIAEVLDEL